MFRNIPTDRYVSQGLVRLQGGWGGWPKGNGKKLSSSQARFTHQNDRESLLYMLVGPKMWINEVNVTVLIDM